MQPSRRLSQQLLRVGGPRAVGQRIADDQLAVRIAAIHKPAVAATAIRQFVPSSRKGHRREPETRRPHHARSRASGSAVSRRRRTRGISSRSPEEHPLDRKFSRRTRRRVGDRHHVRLDLGGWLYLAAILDLFSRRVVGLAMQAHRPAGSCYRRAMPSAAFRTPGNPPLRPRLAYASADYRTRSRTALRLQHEVGRATAGTTRWPSFFATLKTELILPASLRDQGKGAGVFDYVVLQPASSSLDPWLRQSGRF